MMCNEEVYKFPGHYFDSQICRKNSFCLLFFFLEETGNMYTRNACLENETKVF